MGGVLVHDHQPVLGLGDHISRMHLRARHAEREVRRVRFGRGRAVRRFAAVRGFGAGGHAGREIAAPILGRFSLGLAIAIARRLVMLGELVFPGRGGPVRPAAGDRAAAGQRQGMGRRAFGAGASKRVSGHSRGGAMARPRQRMAQSADDQTAHQP